MKPLHAGYVSAAIWDVIQDDKLSNDLDWLDVVKRLSHFVIDREVGGDGVLPAELAVLENIFCRGLPTLPSLFVEKEIENRSGLIRCGVAGKSEISAFTCELQPDLRDRVLPLFERALCIAAPDAELASSPGFRFPDFGSGEENSEFDSHAEKYFWDGPLTKLLGYGGIQIALRQRPLSTIVGDSFSNQRVDVAVQFPGSNRSLPRGIVFEVDGPSHGTVQGKKADERRDEACTKAGWAQTYRHALWQGSKPIDSIDNAHVGVATALQHPYLRRLNENIDSPLSVEEFGRRVQMLALFPFAVARIQRVMLELIRGGMLSLDAPIWHLAILDRDGLIGCGGVAAEDFRIWLNRLWAIYQPGRVTPEIKVYEFQQQSIISPPAAKLDVLLDLSVQLRYGASLSTPRGLHNLNGVPTVVIRSDYYNTAPFHPLAFGDPLFPQIAGLALEKELTFFLQNVFRKQAFRPKQAEIIIRALRGESVIALLPTGAGKSITYQLPTLLQNGISIVVDPIKSLMKDQVDNLQSIGITASAFINSMTAAKERRLNTKLMQQGCFKFVFVSPERFIIQEFRDALNDLKAEGRVYFAYAVIDEAHCVSEWGHDFRTAYLRVGANARRYCSTHLPQLPILALTGTASFEVLDDIQVELGFGSEGNITVRPDSMERKNLKYRVALLTPAPKIPETANDMKVKQIIGEAKQEQLPAVLSELTQTLFDIKPAEFITENKGSGLVFCPHARWVHGVEEVRTTLCNAFDSVNAHFGVYYGSPEEGRVGGSEFDPVRTQNKFKRGELKVLACTKAFGMGIDKPDIRFTLHFNIPPSLESFYQEAGRAGRDGDDSQCWILYSGAQLPIENHTLDYSINYSFHSNTFPGADIEEAKVFEMLEQNRVPGHSVLRDIESMFFDNMGIDFSLRPYHPPNSNIYRIYVNHPDYRDAKVYVTIPQAGSLTAGANPPFPEYEKVTSLVMEWMNDHRPVDTPCQTWLFEESELTVKPGIEELLDQLDGERLQSICLTTDNGYLKEIAQRIKANLHDVTKAYNFVDGAETFIDKLPDSHKIPAATKMWIKSVFPKIRQREHTFRAIYRLTVLGVVDDFVADYANSTITATLRSLQAGECRENLRNYIYRYAPLVVADYLQIADQCGYPSELRRCLHALIQFVYDRIAKQRVSALKIVESTTVNGLKNPKAFEEAVTNIFDSAYLPVLRPHINDYTPDLVFQICSDTDAATTKLNHLLGACNRLIPENPDNAAFHALRAYAIALLAYREQDIKDEIDAALVCFERFFQWGRVENLTFLMRLRNMIATVNIDCARVFDAAIIDDHTKWLRAFNTYVNDTASTEK